MNPSATSFRPTRSFVAVLLVVAIAALGIGWTAGTVAASSGTRAAPATTPLLAAGVNAPGVPSTLVPYAGGAGAGGGTAAGGGVASSGGTTSAIAYPIPGYNSLGVAPEGTILAEGTGTADVKPDGSNQAAALKKATDAALADAHTQALAAAASMGVQLQGIYSTSIASNTDYSYAVSDCVVPRPAPGVGTGATGSAATEPGAATTICPMITPGPPTSAQLVVTLIVAYKFS